MGVTAAADRGFGPRLACGAGAPFQEGGRPEPKPGPVCPVLDYAEAALVRTEAILLKMVLMLVEMPGSRAPAATAMKPASRAYSTRSWPSLSRSKRVSVR